MRSWDRSNECGGVSDDRYIVDNESDLVIEKFPEGGYDKVYSSVTYTTSDNVEELVLTCLKNKWNW